LRTNTALIDSPITKQPERAALNEPFVLDARSDSLY